MKLDDLCAIKIMGWTLERHGGSDFWMEPNGCSHSKAFDWYPSHSVDHALVCLERAAKAGFENYDITRRPNPVKDGIRFSVDCGGCWGYADTLPLAMCLCSLRAMGVPESEISLAMED